MKKSVDRRDVIEFVLLISELCNADYSYRDKVVKSSITELVLELYNTNPNTGDIYFT